VRLLLFTGKGGVGKTTLAAATAVKLAAAGRKALIVSTDQAHSLADVLGVGLGADPVEVDGCAGLYAAQIDTRRLLDGAWSQLREQLAVLLAGAGVDEVAAEELTVLPGVEELLALAEVHDTAQSGPWEVVLVDCAPTAETLRLLALPEAAAGYLERLYPAHRRMVRGLLGGLTSTRIAPDRWRRAADALTRLAERLAALRATLTDADTTSVRLVLTPERVVVAETRRTITTLGLLDVLVDGLVVNRLVPAPLPEADDAPDTAAAWLRARRAEQDAVLAQLRASVAALPVHTVAHRAAEPVGPAALARLGEELPDFLDGEPATRPMMSVRRVAGSGRELDAEFELVVAVPLPADAAIDLARVGDELAVTVDGRRRLLALPSVLRRCDVVAGQRSADGLCITFRPNPRLWMR
jgi:arsenite-transporting ATPase